MAPNLVEDYNDLKSIPRKENLVPNNTDRGKCGAVIVYQAENNNKTRITKKGVLHY